VFRSDPPASPGIRATAALIAKFSDGTVTEQQLERAQSFYIRTTRGSEGSVERAIRTSIRLGACTLSPSGRPARYKCYAVTTRYRQVAVAPLQRQQLASGLEYTDDDAADNLPAYTRFPELFAGARAIWTINLVYDNAVIARKTGALTLANPRRGEFRRRAEEVGYSERRKLSRSCLSVSLRSLNLEITPFASDFLLECSRMARSRSAVRRHGGRRSAATKPNHSGAVRNSLAAGRAWLTPSARPSPIVVPTGRENR